MFLTTVKVRLQLETLIDRRVTIDKSSIGDSFCWLVGICWIGFYCLN